MTMREEQIVTLAMKGETIQEVYFTPWTFEESDDELRVSSDFIRLPVEHEIDALVFELPYGCYQFDLDMRVYPGDTIQLMPGGGRPLKQCDRPRSFAQPQEATIGS